MRISRPNYDKMHRCPGWSGGGMTFTETSRCDGGRLKRGGNMDAIFDGRWWAWRFNRCATCGLLVLPYMVRWVDPAWLRYRASCLWRWKLLPLWQRLRDRRS